MRVPGYWVEGTGAGVTVQPYVFDDTELSESSGWKEAPQNEDADSPYGFVDPIAMLREVCRRILRASTADIEVPSFGENGTEVAISDAEQLARLVLRVTDPKQGE